MQIQTFATPDEMARAAASAAADLLRAAIEQRGQAVFVAATGASQFEFLRALAAEAGIDWARTTMFHLDEYIGLADDHPASFRRYLRERLVQVVRPGTVHWIGGDAPDSRAECARLGQLIRAQPVDAAFVGIGENGHLAFNDPPADFATTEPYIVVDLDDACRRQQLGEGWFATLDDVPNQAISMSIRQILAARQIICTVPERRKAAAVRACLLEPVSPLRPASILREHGAAQLFLDQAAAALL